MTRLVLIAVLALAGASGCGVASKTGSTPTAAPIGLRATGAPAPTMTAESAAVTETASEPGLFTCGLPLTRAASGSGLAQPTTARVGGQSGHDRIVFVYAGAALPSLTITSATPPFAGDPSARPLPVAGMAFLALVFRNLPGIASGYSGPTSFTAGLTFLTDLELRGDFEGVQQWVAGLSGRACVRVFALTRPTRLVVDLAPASLISVPNTGG
ncbi:MAG TPA: hypothetical protein VI316_09675 [Candidatus Dormibacteraeota bacterium]